VKWPWPRKPKKTAPVADADRVKQQLMSRYNPIRGLNPTTLIRHLDNFEAGNLKAVTQLWEKMEERDDTLCAVAPKRKKSVARHEWEIVSFDESTEATKQKEELEYFFGGLTATSAIDENLGGDVNLLIEQMMDAEGKRWSSHEIVYQPSPNGLTAQFRHVPLWFFEHETSRLRYLETEGSVTGVDLVPGEWLVTRGSGLMIACSILYTVKHMPLKDLLNYCERYAVPGLHGKTDAAKGSTEWNDLKAALAAFGIDWSLITNTAAKIDSIDVSAKGQLPHPQVVSWASRSMSTIWRGGDLSTMSAKDSVGASVQEGETEILEDSDLELIEGTLNRNVVPFVVWYTRGTREIKAGFHITRPHREDTEQERETDTFLLKAGVELSKSDLRERYGRAMPDAGEDLASWSEGSTAGDGLAPGAGVLPNARYARLVNAALVGSTPQAARALAEQRSAELQAAARVALGKALAGDLAPLANAFRGVLAIENDAELVNAGRALLAKLEQDPLEFFPEVTQAGRVLEDTMAAGLVNGYVEGAVARPLGDTEGGSE